MLKTEVAEPAVIKKEKLTGFKKSYYWLLFGVNPDILYGPASLEPFETSISGEEIAQFVGSMGFAIDLMDGLGQRTHVPSPDQELVMTFYSKTSYVKTGKCPSVTLTQNTNGGDAKLAHGWIEQTDEPQLRRNT